MNLRISSRVGPVTDRSPCSMPAGTWIWESRALERPKLVTW